MHYFTFWTFVFIYLFGVPITESGDSKICNAAGDCTGELVCLKEVARSIDGSLGNFCGQKCTQNTVVDDCGPNETCETKKDIDDKDTLSCVKSADCITDAYCLKINPDKPICNLFTLKCIGTGITTTESIPTTPKKVISTVTPCEDFVVGGPYDCKSNQNRCKDPIWLDLMREKCKKTCGYCGKGTESGGTSVGCNDHLSDCSKYNYLCKNPAYVTFMKQNCPATCNYC
uniref:ShKT domain-containing protein n=1 Tax=Strongyloides stercoralis TaxID=6248 RepID=A0A0K0DYV7_STRER